MKAKIMVAIAKRYATNVTGLILFTAPLMIKNVEPQIAVEIISPKKERDVVNFFITIKVYQNIR